MYRSPNQGPNSPWYALNKTYTCDLGWYVGMLTPGDVSREYEENIIQIM